MADTDQAHECCLSCTLLASMAPVEVVASEPPREETPEERLAEANEGLAELRRQLAMGTKSVAEALAAAGLNVPGDDGDDLGDLPHPSTGSLVLTAVRGRVLKIEDLGPANGEENVAGREIARMHQEVLREFSEQVRSQARAVKEIVDEAMQQPRPLGLRNPGRYANRIVDLICDRIEGRP